MTTSLTAVDFDFMVAYKAPICPTGCPNGFTIASWRLNSWANLMGLLESVLPFNHSLRPREHKSTHIDVYILVYFTHRNRKLNISTAYSQALVQNKIDKQRV